MFTKKNGRGPLTALVLLTVSLATLLTSGCVTTSGALLGSDGKRSGEQLYRRRCIECHGLYAPTRFTDTEWAGIVPEMAREARLSKEDARLVLEYLQQANG